MSKATHALDAVPLRNLKCEIEAGESPRQIPTPPSGALVEAAMHRARMTVKQLAGLMGVSESFLLRGFKDQESISWQRVHAVSDPRFRRALIAVQAEDLTGAVVLIQLPQEKSA